MLGAKQGTCTIMEYANYLKWLWQEIDFYQNIQIKCNDDASVLKRFVENDRIYDFLVGLNMKLDLVRVQILEKGELPSLNETIALIKAEEGRHGVMIETPKTKSSALVTKNTNLKMMTFD